MAWAPPGSRHSAYSPSIHPSNATSPSQPHPESARTPTHSAGSQLASEPDYCCSTKSAEKGRRIYDYYESAPQKGYTTVVLTLWIDRHEKCGKTDCGTKDCDTEHRGAIVVTVAPLFPYQTVEYQSGDTSINYHMWDQPERRDEAFEAANRLLRALHSDQSIYRCLTGNTVFAKRVQHRTDKLAQTLNYLSDKNGTNNSQIRDDEKTIKLHFRSGTKHPSEWTAEGSSKNMDPLFTTIGHSKLDPDRAKPLQRLLSQNLNDFKPPWDCPTGQIGNVTIYTPGGHVDPSE